MCAPQRLNPSKVAVEHDSSLAQPPPVSTAAAAATPLPEPLHPAGPQAVACAHSRTQARRHETGILNLRRGSGGSKPIILSILYDKIIP